MTIEPDPTINAVLRAVSDLCTACLDGGGDPAALADGLRRQADDLFEEPKGEGKRAAPPAPLLTGPNALQRAKAMAAAGESSRIWVEDEHGHRHEVRRLPDGLISRRTSLLMPSDRVQCLPENGGLTTAPAGTAEGIIVRVHQDLSGAPLYEILLDNSRGSHRILPHGRVCLIWPESAIEATAFVMIHDDRRLGWKIMRDNHEKWFPDSRYYGRGDQRPPVDACKQQRATFDNWNDAVRWCATFPPHPAEGGAPPRLSDDD